jgi:hypothetical protein
MKCVRRDLDAGADFAEFCRLFQDNAVDAASREAEGGCQSANTAAGDQDISQDRTPIGVNAIARLMRPASAYFNLISRRTTSPR